MKHGKITYTFRITKVDKYGKTVWTRPDTVGVTLPWNVDDDQWDKNLDEWEEFITECHPKEEGYRFERINTIFEFTE